VEDLVLRWRVLIVVLLSTGLLAALLPPAPPVSAAGNYKLPTPPGTSYLLTQGNNSGGTHSGAGAWGFDFYVSTGTPVFASRAGVVQLIKQDSNTGGCDPAQTNNGNYIVLDHQDGTRSLYLHLKHNGIAAGIFQGKRVEQGELIAYSGATGYVCSVWPFPPDHLHFQVQTYNATAWQSTSLPTIFADYNNPNYNGVPPHRSGTPLEPFESVTSRNFGFTTLAKKWYLAEGYTATNFDEYLTIQNPNPTPASATITYYITGQSQPTVKNLGIPPNSRFTVVVHDSTTYGVGRDKAVSALVEADVPIIVERPMYFKYGPSLWDGGHNGAGVTPYHDNGQYVWWFAEGWTGSGFDEYITVQNTHPATAANLTIIYMYASGGTFVTTRTIPPKTRDTWNVKDHVGANQAVSIKLKSNDMLVVAERPMYFVYGTGAWTGGHVTAGSWIAEYTWYFADGSTLANFDTFFTIQNPGSEGPNNPAVLPTYPDGQYANVTFRFYHQSGTLADQYSISIPPKTRFTLNPRSIGLNNARFSAEITSNFPIIAERPMYFGNSSDGTVVVGLPKPEYTLYFAEGSTSSPAFTEKLVIHNTASSVANITAQYMLTNGTVVSKQYNGILPKMSIEKDVRTEIGGNYDVSIKVTSNVPIVAERPMYFTYNGTSPGAPGVVVGGHTVMGISP
jgi:murein DD-endopeptidase MepM/ murein hydrolase activator NlpD